MVPLLSRWVTLCMVVLLAAWPAAAAPKAPSTPPAKLPVLERATFGGGCFWCLEPVFEELKGVSQVVSGYAGGHQPNPTYEAVCRGTTGHAEVVQVQFDPRTIRYADLVRVFFAIHDPTTLNRQGADHGTQYRSILLAHSSEQEKAARHVVRELTAKGLFAKPIVTEIRTLRAFYPAEDYHQDYYAKNPDKPYCVLVVAPKLAKFRERYLAKLK